MPCQRDAGTRLTTALRRRPFSTCNKGNRRRLHAGKGSADKDWNPVSGILNPKRVLDCYLQTIECVETIFATSFPLKEKHDADSGTHHLLNIKLVFLAFLYFCIWLTWRSALWHKLLGLTWGLSQEAKLQCMDKLSCIMLRSEFLWKTEFMSVLYLTACRLNLPTYAALWRP